jgi:hypothetical protein
MKSYIETGAEMTYEEYAETYDAMVLMVNIAFPNGTSVPSETKTMVEMADIIADFTLKHYEHFLKYEGHTKITVVKE